MEITNKKKLFIYAHTLIAKIDWYVNNAKFILTIITEVL